MTGTDPAPPARTFPSWRVVAAACPAGVAATAVLTWWQLWFAPFAVAAAAAVLLRRHRCRGLAVVALAGTAAAGGWAMPLAWRAATGEPVAAVARVTAVLAGLPASGALLLAVTILVALLQALLGVWLGLAVAGLRRSAP